VVGNDAILVEKERGQEIDAHDTVIRIGHFKDKTLLNPVTPDILGCVPRRDFAREMAGRSAVRERSGQSAADEALLARARRTATSQQQSSCAQKSYRLSRGSSTYTTRPAGYPSSGAPPAVERQLHLLSSVYQPGVDFNVHGVAARASVGRGARRGRWPRSLVDPSLSLSLSLSPSWTLLSLSLSLSLVDPSLSLSLSLPRGPFSLSLSLPRGPFSLSLSLSLPRGPFSLSLSLSLSPSWTLALAPHSHGRTGGGTGSRRAWGARPASRGSTGKPTWRVARRMR
jgi:hypothetical protein